MRATYALLAIIAGTAGGAAIVSAQSPQSSKPEPTFDVVSIRPNAASQAGRFENSTTVNRPDGGLTWTRVPVMTLIARAYPIGVPADFVGLPEWARREQYDVNATASLPNATPDDRLAMLRAMLA